MNIFDLKLPPIRNKEYAYKMGMDCALNGANEKNCSFSIFSTPENTTAWERGKRDASKQEKNHEQIIDVEVAGK